MKIIIYLSISLILLTSSINSIKTTKTRDPSLKKAISDKPVQPKGEAEENKEPILKSGEVCFRSIPGFGPAKACEDGLVCRVANPQPGMTGGPKICLKPEENNEPKLKSGEVCFRSIPGFGPAKACEEGLVCKVPKPQPGMTGGPKICLKA